MNGPSYLPISTGGAGHLLEPDAVTANSIDISWKVSVTLFSFDRQTPAVSGSCPIMPACTSSRRKCLRTFGKSTPPSWTSWLPSWAFRRRWSSAFPGSRSFWGVPVCLVVNVVLALSHGSLGFTGLAVFVASVLSLPLSLPLFGVARTACVDDVCKLGWIFNVFCKQLHSLI